MRLTELFNLTKKTKAQLCTKTAFIECLTENVKNLNPENQEMFSAAYDRYVALWNSIEAGGQKPSPSGIAVFLGFDSQMTTLKYFLDRGWPEREASEKLKTRQGTNCVDRISKKYGVSIEEAAAILKTRSDKGIDTVRNRADYEQICHSRGNGNRWQFYLNKINPKTNLNFTEDEARQIVNKKQKIGFDNFWADVKSGKKIYTSNTKLEYYLNKGLSEDEALDALTLRQTTFSKEICISKLGEKDGIKRWVERQEKWQNTLKSLPEEVKRDIMLRRTASSKRYSGEATRFIHSLLDKLGIDKNDSDIFMCEHEKFLWYNGRLAFYDLYIGRYNLFLEYNGSSFHPNPKLLDTPEKWNAWVNPIAKFTADEQQARDNHKKEGALLTDCLFYIVWDTDNHSEMIDKINFEIKEKYE